MTTNTVKMEYDNIMEVLVVRCMEDGKEGANCSFELDESERMNRFIQEFLVNGRVGMEI